MDAYDRLNNLGKNILPIVLLSMVEAENFSDHPCKWVEVLFHTFLTSALKGSTLAISQSCKWQEDKGGHSTGT
jgi:hypothetical protein